MKGQVAHAAFSGGFVVAWESFGQDGSLAGVFGQRFGATGARPIVLTNAEGLFTNANGAAAVLNLELVRKTMGARGLTDPIDQQVHLAVLRRAIGQADGS